MKDLVGLFKDRVPTFDVRRLYNTRSYLMRMAKQNGEPTLPYELVFAKIDHILGEGLHKTLLLEFIT